MSSRTATDESQRVVVTGYGTISALGNTAEALRSSLRGTMSGLRTITRFDASDYPTSFAAEVVDFDPESILDRKQSRRMDRFTQFASVAAREAVARARLDVAADPTRVGVVLGTAFGGVETFVQTAEVMLSKGPKRISPFAVPMTIPNIAPGMIAIDLGAKGPAFAYASAFASSANAIGEAMRMIQSGRADTMIAGGTEAPITGLLMAGFAALQSLSRRNDDPGQAVRPFDLHRDGCALGEGAAMLVLERRDQALSRGATILAEFVGYGSTADAWHDVQIAPAGEGLARAMSLALDEAGVAPGDVGYLNAHGTGTTMNDELETVAIKTAFGDAACHLPISSTKSRTGHLLGAAGALEAVIVIQALEDDLLPSTLNLKTPDPACDLDYIPGSSRSAPIDLAMTNSMGFGGHNVSLVFRGPDSR
ncbi:MAG: beta-ketoacyl-ACP synthase II [Chloroflexota bacterium]|nr:beta-ketoacyl-ACP synthase II [Chloroflexota bacterium]